MHNIIRIHRTRHAIREETAIAYNNITVLLHEFLQKRSAKHLAKKCKLYMMHLKDYGSIKKINFFLFISAQLYSTTLIFFYNVNLYLVCILVCRYIFFSQQNSATGG